MPLVMHGQYQASGAWKAAGWASGVTMRPCVAFGYTELAWSLREAGQIGGLEEDGRRCFEARLIVGIETVFTWAVEVEHPEQSAAVNQRHDELRAGRGVAGDVTRESMH